MTGGAASAPPARGVPAYLTAASRIAAPRMNDFVRVDNRYVPLHTIVHVDDDGEHVVISLREPRTGPAELRLGGEEADRLRGWLSERTALTLRTQADVQDTGYRSDD